MERNELTTRLEEALQSIADLLINLQPDDWQRPQGEKWTIADEFEHLRLSTQATAFVLSSAGRLRWHDHPGGSRSFDTIVAQYDAGLAANPGLTNAGTRPATNAPLSLTDQRTNWTQLVPMLLQVLDALPESDLDAYTVWKHPLLGPLTVREMIYFTTHHTTHHQLTMAGKQAASGVSAQR